MFHKFIVPVLLIAVFVLSACTKDLHGGGVVTLFSVETPGGPGQLGTANMAISFTCNDAKNKIGGILHWTDNANGVNFTARLPQTPVSMVFGSGVDTCEQASAAAQTAGISANMAQLNTHGQMSGLAIVAVGEPNSELLSCGAGVSGVIVATTDVNDTTTYIAFGCLNRGNIIFQ